RCQLPEAAENYEYHCRPRRAIAPQTGALYESADKPTRIRFRPRPHRAARRLLVTLGAKPAASWPLFPLLRELPDCRVQQKPCGDDPAVACKCGRANATRRGLIGRKIEVI